MGAIMSEDTDVLRALGYGIADLLFRAVQLQAEATRQGDLATAQRIAAFIAGVSATESACLHTDHSSGAFMLSRVDEHQQLH